MSIFDKAVHLGGKIMQHFNKALRTVSLILGFAMVTFGCATSKNQVADEEIGLKAEAVPEGICLTFDNIPPETSRIFISLTKWGEPINNPYEVISSHADIRGSLLDQVKDSGKVIFPFVKAGQEYRISVTFQKEGFQPIENIPEWLYTECVPYTGVFYDGDIKLNLNGTFTSVTLSSEPIFSGEVHYSIPKYSIMVSLYTENIGVGGFTNTVSENILTMYFEPEMSDDLKKGDYLKNGNYPAYITGYCNLIYDNITWGVEIAKSSEFTYSL
jgi:hypothetical protein